MNFRRVQQGSTAHAAAANVARAFESRRGDIVRSHDASVKLHRASGFVTVQDPGEVAIEVMFPVWFVEKPSFFYGGELAQGHSPEAENFPTISVVVLRWITRDRGDAQWFIGANLGIVTSGREGHQMIAHWHMEGKAMTNPLGGTADTGGTI